MDAPGNRSRAIYVHPFQGGQFDGLLDFSKRQTMDQFDLVQAVDDFYQSVFIAVAFAAHGGLYARFGQALSIAGRKLY